MGYIKNYSLLQSQDGKGSWHVNASTGYAIDDPYTRILPVTCCGTMSRYTFKKMYPQTLVYAKDSGDTPWRRAVTPSKDFANPVNLSSRGPPLPLVIVTGYESEGDSFV